MTTQEIVERLRALAQEWRDGADNAYGFGDFRGQSVRMDALMNKHAAMLCDLAEDIERTGASDISHITWNADGQRLVNGQLAPEHKPSPLESSPDAAEAWSIDAAMARVDAAMDDERGK